MCTDADHAKSAERELLSLLQQQVLVSERLLQESRQTNALLSALVQAMAEDQGDSDEDQPHTYLDGSLVR